MTKTSCAVLVRDDLTTDCYLLLFDLQLTGFNDHYFLACTAWLWSNGFHLSDNIHSLDDGTEDNMLAIKPEKNALAASLNPITNNNQTRLFLSISLFKHLQKDLNDPEV